MTSNQTSFHSMNQHDVHQSYQGFQSERHNSQNNHESQDQSNGLVREYHIKYPIQTLLTHFKTIFNDRYQPIQLRGFKTTEVFPGKIMLVKLEFYNRLKYILYSKSPSKYLLTIKTQQYKSVRKVFINKLQSHKSTSDQTKIQICQLFTWIDKNNNKIPQLCSSNQNNNSQSSPEYEQDIFSLEATSTYMYHKIFVDKNYSMGRKMDKLVNQNNDLQSGNESEVIIGGLKQITQDMLKSFNCTRKQLLQILCHCRKTVQDYYHDRKFILPSKENIELDRGSIETQINKKVPLTIKSLFRLIHEKNSQKIIRQIFLISYIFQLECSQNKISQSNKKTISKKLNNKFAKQLQNKSKYLILWGYSQNYIINQIQNFLN